jgi:hypothetical protein
MGKVFGLEGSVGGTPGAGANVHANVAGAACAVGDVDLGAKGKFKS